MVEVVTRGGSRARRDGTKITGVDGFPETWRERPRKTTSLRPKIVCKPCNNEWMSVLQERARPYLAGPFRRDKAHLDGATQDAIAAWLAMTAMIGVVGHQRLRRLGDSENASPATAEHQPGP